MLNTQHIFLYIPTTFTHKKGKTNFTQKSKITPYYRFACIYTNTLSFHSTVFCLGRKLCHRRRSIYIQIYILQNNQSIHKHFVK